LTNCSRAGGCAGSNYPFLTPKERDNETGLDFFDARYFASTQGRFTSPDEFTGGPDELFGFAQTASNNPTFYADLTNPQSLNKYQYTYNNPLRYTYSDGHCPEGQPCPNTSIPAMKPAPGTGAVAVDVVISVGKVAANLLTGMSNMGNIAINGSNAQLTAPFDSSSKMQDVAMHALEVLTLVSPLLAEAGPVTVMSAQSRPAADMAANEAQQLPASIRPGAAGALTTRDGQTFTATSSGNPNLEPGVKAALDAVPSAQRSAYHGRCYEPRLVSAA
jgi:RHS repeat-associated protein